MVRKVLGSERVHRKGEKGLSGEIGSKNEKLGAIYVYIMFPMYSLHFVFQDNLIVPMLEQETNTGESEA